MIAPAVMRSARELWWFWLLLVVTITVAVLAVALDDDREGCRYTHTLIVGKTQIPQYDCDER